VVRKEKKKDIPSLVDKKRVLLVVQTSGSYLKSLHQTLIPFLRGELNKK